MNKLVFIVFVFLSLNNFAQKNQPVGARAGAMGNAALSNIDVWAVHQNQANMAFLEKAEAGVFYRNQFFIPEFGYGGAALALPTNFGTIGISLFSLGNELYRESEYGLAYAQKFGDNIAMGLQLNYSEVAFGENYGRKGTINGEFGITAKLNEEFFMAAHIYNPTQARFAVFADERLPTILKTGFGYKLSEFALFTLEGEKEINEDLRLKVGAELEAVPGFFIRAGALTKPIETTFGFGFEMSKLQLDFASSYHSILGYSPQMGLTFKFN